MNSKYVLKKQISTRFQKLGKLVDSALSEHFSLSARTTVIPLPGLNNWTKNTNLAMLNKASILIRRILYLSAEMYCSWLLLIV